MYPIVYLGRATPPCLRSCIIRHSARFAGVSGISVYHRTMSENFRTSFFRNPCVRGLLLCLLVPAFTGTYSLARTRPIPVRVVVITMFEVGNDIGDGRGELQYWVERDHLDRIFPLTSVTTPCA